MLIFTFFSIFASSNRFLKTFAKIIFILEEEIQDQQKNRFELRSLPS